MVIERLSIRVESIKGVGCVVASRRRGVGNPGPETVRAQEVNFNMVNTDAFEDDATQAEMIQATLAVKAWRWKRQGKLPGTVDVLAQQGISTENRGDAKDLLRQMADDDAAPFEWDTKALDRVNLAGADESETKGWVKSWAQRNGMKGSALPWDLR